MSYLGNVCLEVFIKVLFHVLFKFPGLRISFYSIELLNHKPETLCSEEHYSLLVRKV